MKLATTGLWPVIPWGKVHEIIAEGANSSELPDWAAPALLQVTSILRGDYFPCIFARRANQRKSGWLCFVDSVESQSGREAVKHAILAYLRVVNSLPPESRITMPLMVITKPCYPMRSLKDYRDQAWGLFQYLHENDPEDWPVDVPTNPERGDWSFCFGGTQLFSNVSNPAHRIHKSRNLGDSLVFAMQPRTNFDVVAGNNPKGRLVRKQIRERAERYEGRPVASHLGFFGTPENREWKQMAAKDSEEEHDYPQVCPFKFRSDRGTTHE